MHACRESTREAGRLGCGRLGCLGRLISFGALPTAEFIDRSLVLISCSRVLYALQERELVF